MHYKSVDKVIHMPRVHFAEHLCFQRCSQGGFEGDTDLSQKCTICLSCTIYWKYFNQVKKNVSNNCSLMRD